jgi:hypothetical protein
MRSACSAATAMAPVTEGRHRERSAGRVQAQPVVGRDDVAVDLRLPWRRKARTAWALSAHSVATPIAVASAKESQTHPSAIHSSL